MVLTITLPDELETALYHAASVLALPVEEAAIDLLREAFRQASLLTPEEVVAHIQALPRNPANFRPAIGSLADVLAVMEDTDFDLAAWEAVWARVEAEMEEIELADQRRDRQRYVLNF